MTARQFHAPADKLTVTQSGVLTTTGTTLQLVPGDGGRLPSIGASALRSAFYLHSGISAGDPVEVVRVTAVSGDTCTVQRAQLGTTAAQHPDGALWELRFHAAHLGELQDAFDAAAGHTHSGEVGQGGPLRLQVGQALGLDPTAASQLSQQASGPVQLTASAAVGNGQIRLQTAPNQAVRLTDGTNGILQADGGNLILQSSDGQNRLTLFPSPSPSALLQTTLRLTDGTNGVLKADNGALILQSSDGVNRLTLPTNGVAFLSGMLQLSNGTHGIIQNTTGNLILRTPDGIDRLSIPSGGAATFAGTLTLTGGGLAQSSLVLNPTGDAAQIQLKDNVTNIHKYLRVSSGRLEVVNTANTSVLWRLDDSGNVWVLNTLTVGQTTGGSYRLNVLGGQIFTDTALLAQPAANTNTNYIIRLAHDGAGGETYYLAQRLNDAKSIGYALVNAAFTGGWVLAMPGNSGSLVCNQIGGGGSRWEVTTAGTLIQYGNLWVGSASAAWVTERLSVQQSDSASWAQAVLSPRLGLLLGVGDSTSGNLLYFYRNDGWQTLVGSITHNGTNTGYNTSSDERLKRAFRPTRYGLEALRQLRVHDFEWRATGRADTGLVAQEVHAVYPAAVWVPDDPALPWGLDYGRLTPLCIAAIQELAARVEALEARAA